MKVISISASKHENSQEYKQPQVGLGQVLAPSEIWHQPVEKTFSSQRFMEIRIAEKDLWPQTMIVITVSHRGKYLWARRINATI